MNAIDVLALPSRTTARWKEQFGRVLIEASACGTPVIGARSGAIPDVVGQGGLTFPERDPKSLADAIRQLHADPASARKMGQSGRQQVDEQYTWERVAQRMYSIYQTLVGEPAEMPTPRSELANAAHP
jgi:glycosyltransferase involved in cell wall biosynthesis